MCDVRAMVVSEVSTPTVMLTWRIGFAVQGFTTSLWQISAPVSPVVYGFEHPLAIFADCCLVQRSVGMYVKVVKKTIETCRWSQGQGGTANN